MNGMGGAIALLGTMFVVIMAISLAVGIFSIVVMWKLFEKAGEKGWKALIPFYNTYVLFNFTWGNGWLFLLMLIPVGNTIIMIATLFKLAKAFGQEVAFGFGLLFLSLIFMAILAFGKAEYVGPQPYKKGIIIGAVVVSVIYMILMITIGVAAIMIGTKPLTPETIVNQNPVVESEEADDEGEEQYNYEGTDENPSMEGFTMENLVNGDIAIKVPVMKSDYTDIDKGYAYSSKDGVTVILGTYGSYEKPVPEEILKERVDSFVSVKKDVSSYSDVVTEDMWGGDGFAGQQIDYNYIDYNGEKSPCFSILKVDSISDSGYMLIQIEMDNSQATVNSRDTLMSVCEMYGVDFDLD